MTKPNDQIYSLRKSFSIIGLTGRAGAGVEEVANILSSPFSKIKDVQPFKKDVHLNNKMRKYNISYNYAEKHWKVYKVVNYEKVVFLHLLRTSQNEILDYLNSVNMHILDPSKSDGLFSSYQSVIEKIGKLKSIDSGLKASGQLQLLAEIFFSPEYNHLFEEFCKKVIGTESSRMKFFEMLAITIRKYGKVNKGKDVTEEHIYTIAETINRIIKGYKLAANETHVVICSLRNSLEIMFFKERYSAFYMVAVNSAHRRALLNKRIENLEEVDDILNFDQDSYLGKGAGEGDYHISDIGNCIQKSDIYFNHNPPFEDRSKNLQGGELLKRCEYYLVGQIIKYTSLILHPGLSTPSAQERCMQLAYVAMSNSGCISRQVGAVITDGDYSVKSVGWNDVAKNLTPCNLRNIYDLRNEFDGAAYSPYEKEVEYGFKSQFDDYYGNVESRAVDGLNCSYCFKDFQNLIESKENQVHTRSLHAEENAMLQISKNGGQPLKDGVLFTTASPCELCAKKARQLNIQQIYYIDPYPGISEWHILRDGASTPDLILFSGAVGRAYHKLYEPFMSYKDEIAMIIGKRPKNDLRIKLSNGR